MRKLVLVILCLGLSLSFVGAEDGAYADPAYIPEDEKETKIQSICPKTLMDSSCMTCHLSPDFSLRTLTLEEQYNNDGGTYPSDFRMVREDGKEYGYYLLGEINSYNFERVFEWLSLRPHIKHLVVEIFSPGGSVFHAKRMLTLMDEFKSKGNTIETRSRGLSASAGFLILLNGTKGMRYVSSQSEIMWHEIRVIEGWFLKLVTPADKEGEALIMRHWQDTQDSWIADRCKLTKKQVTELIRHKDHWCNGREAVEQYGFADKLIK